MSFMMNAAQKLDFSNSLAPKAQMKGLYAGTIAARLAASRSKEEFRETFTRDIPGWLTLFYLASIVENAVGFLLDKASPASQAKDGFSLIKGQGEKSFLQMLNPLTKHKVRSFQEIEFLKEVADPKNYKELRRNKAAVFAIGLLAPILTLGILIPWFNVQITRKQMLGEEKGNAKEKSNHFSHFA